MNREEANQKIQFFYEQEELYLLLSFSKADWIKGYSIPFVGEQPTTKKKIIYIFTDYEKALAYARKNMIGAVDDIYPIGKICGEQMVTKLETLCTNAALMGIDVIDFDQEQGEAAFGCELLYFMEQNHITKEASMLMSKLEYEKRMATDQNKIVPRFHPFPIYHFQPIIRIDTDRASEIIKHMFQDEDGGFLYFKTNLTLNESCFLLDYLEAVLIPKALEQGNKTDAEWFQDMSYTFCGILQQKLKSTASLYTVRYKKNKALYLKEDRYYLLYSNRCITLLENNLECVKIECLEEFFEEVGEQGKLLVTDGFYMQVKVPLFKLIN